MLGRQVQRPREIVANCAGTRLKERNAPHRAIRVFFSYSRRDESLRDELELHLTILKRQGAIDSWHDRRLCPGDVFSLEIDWQLSRADVILLLVSPDFLASDYCYGVEMDRAIRLHNVGDARVIPIILRPVDWQGAPFAHMQVLPTNGTPISVWPSIDEAFLDVALGLRKVVEEIRLLPRSRG